MKKEIDWDNKGVDKDLYEIADSMDTDWEVILAIPLELTQEEIDDIKDKHTKDHPKLMRYTSKLF